MIVSGSTTVRLGAAIRAGCTIVGLSTLILFALSCRLPTASAQSLQLNEKREIVPDLAAARRALDSARGSTRAARGVDSEAGQLQRMLPDEKTEGLKTPIVVLSDSKARSTRAVRTPLSDRKQASAQRALETMVRDESGKWY